MKTKDDKRHENLIDEFPNLGVTMPKQVFDAIRLADETTNDYLGDLWKSNVKENMSKFFPSCGWLNDGYAELGKYKAVITVGSGPSLKKNKDYLKTLSLTDGTREFEDQDFIVMTPNHQLKSCFKAGIIPHFGMLGDGSPDLADQMDVGDTGKYTTLIASIVASPDVIAKWKGPVKFICPKSPAVIEIVEEHLGKKLPEGWCVTGGGNIMNLSFSIGVGLFRSSVWMCVGNDLSYPVASNLKDRRKGYYEDGDYSTNIKSKRDEARNEIVWAGFKLRDNVIWSPRNTTLWEGEWRYTANQLFLYKSWLETNAMMLWDRGEQFHIYNCSEAGILGMMLKEEMIPPEKYDEKFDPDSWFLLDEISKGRWRTRSLFHACEEFHDAKIKLFGRDKWSSNPIISDVQSAKIGLGNKIIH